MFFGDRDIKGIAYKVTQFLRASLTLLACLISAPAIAGTCYSGTSDSFTTNDSSGLIDLTSTPLAAGTHTFTVSWTTVNVSPAGTSWVSPLAFSQSASSPSGRGFSALNSFNALTSNYTETVTVTLSGTTGAFRLNPADLAGPGSVTVVVSSLTLTSPSCTGSSSSSSSSSSSTATSTTTAVTYDVFARTTATISGNTRVMDMALTRFLTENRSGAGDIITRDNVTGPLGLQVTGFNLDADDDGGFLFSSMSYMDVANGWRRVGFAELSFQDTTGVGSTLSVNGRISQERYLTASTLYGYFLGAELHRSDIKGSFAGDQDSWGVMAGAYTVTKAENGLIGSAYGAVGFNRSDLNIGDATTTVTDSYDTRSVMLGAKLSGDLDYTTYRLRPSLAANYAQTDIGTLNMTETTSGTASDLAVAIGTVRFMDIVATPEFIFDVDQIGEGFSDTAISVAPRLTCERRDAATDTRKCGSGLALGLSSNSSDGMTTLNGGVSFDRIGGQDRRSIQLQAEMRF